ncbi:hypothetical protein AVEN_158580-1 [Araneus ventricosus]|uniref:Uncharacterized protein n=1 Tax=Araneus ventricosus TaxID=182803 RepID=A0A4Y2JQ99_ARAVE|nr:hypothetical protein AVEN_158580-1 [Araneus ventricosus]
MTEIIRHGWSEGKDTGAVFVDVAKEFDKFLPIGLIYKFMKMGVPDALTRLIASYLNNRSFEKRDRLYILHIFVNLCVSAQKPPDGARIVRHNDESVREGYIRNGGKEVKLFTSALKAFQCNNRIVMAQRKHLDDFLRGRIIGRLECGRTQLEVSEELGIAQSVISRL